MRVQPSGAKRDPEPEIEFSTRTCSSAPLAHSLYTCDRWTEIPDRSPTILARC
jgi:hypothetical protein